MTKMLGSIELLDLDHGHFEELIDGRPQSEQRQDSPAEVHVIADLQTLKADLNQLFEQYLG